MSNIRELFRNIPKKHIKASVITATIIGVIILCLIYPEQSQIIGTIVIIGLIITIIYVSVLVLIE